MLNIINWLNDVQKCLIQFILILKLIDLIIIMIIMIIIQLYSYYIQLIISLTPQQGIKILANFK